MAGLIGLNSTNRTLDDGEELLTIHGNEQVDKIEKNNLKLSIIQNTVDSNSKIKKYEDLTVALFGEIYS